MSDDSIFRNVSAVATVPGRPMRSIVPELKYGMTTVKLRT